MDISIVTFNILSSKLSSEDYFPFNTEDELNPQKRFEINKGYLKRFIESEDIICLQEVCKEYRSKLEVFFNLNDYITVCDNYGSRFNGYMGVMIAFPKKNFIITDCKFMNPALYYRHEPEYEPLTPLAKGYNLIASLLGSKKIEIETEKSINTKREFEKSHNHFIYLKLLSLHDDREFTVTNVHMPCKFYNPDFMCKYMKLFLTNHPSLNNEKEHTIICGDFNSKVSDPWFKLLRSVKRLDNDKLYSTVTRTKDMKEVFREKIDYIFVSNNIRCVELNGYTSNEDLLPNLQLGSDHRPVQAVLEM